MQALPTPSAIILSAGYSSRMGDFKPLLTLGGMAAIDRVIGAYQAAGVTNILVVTGYRSATIQEALRSRSVHRVHNPDHDAGMFSSIVAGIKALPETAPGFFVHPVDIPLVRPHTIRLLLDAGRDPSPTVVYPTFDDRRGHPPLIRATLKQAILAHDGQGGLRGLLDGFEGEALDIPVADNGVVLDMDTPDDYVELSNRSDAAAFLNDDECRALMEKVYHLPGSIIDHCRQVARVAVRIAQALNVAGATLDTARIRSAALIHDVARLEKNHAAAGARLLEQMGFSGLAEIVAVHMQIDVDETLPMDEAQVVHLADKCVAGRAIVSPRERFDAKLRKYGHDPIIAEKIEQRRLAALTIQAKVERATTMTMNEILAKDALGKRCKPC